MASVSDSVKRLGLASRTDGRTYEQNLSTHRISILPLSDAHAHMPTIERFAR